MASQASLFNFGFSKYVDHTSSSSSSTHCSESESYSSTTEVDAGGTPRPNRFRHFMPRWKKTWPWVDYDKEKNIMYCGICRKVCAVYIIVKLSII